MKLKSLSTAVLLYLVVSSSVLANAEGVVLVDQFALEPVSSFSSKLSSDPMDEKLFKQNQNPEFYSAPEVSSLKVFAKKWSDGTITVDGAGTTSAYSEPFSYEFKVDFNNRSIEISPPKARYIFGNQDYLEEKVLTQSKENNVGLSASQLSSFRKAIKENPSPREAMKSLSPRYANASLSQKQTSFATLNGGEQDYGFKKVTVRTYDPVFIQLTRTSTSTFWTTLNGSQTWLTAQMETWVANPSPLNTHWFVQIENI